MDYKKIDNIGDMECATKVEKHNEQWFGTLRVNGVEHFDTTSYWDSTTQAEESLDHMVNGYRKSLHLANEWGEYVRSKFAK